MSEWQYNKLESYLGSAISLGRGDIISKDDINDYPGPYPIYSSSAHNNGKFGEFGKFMFDEELITWSIDGGGSFFYRPKHKFSVTNVCGYMRIREKELDAQFIYYCLSNQHKYLTFDYTTKAHPSVIKKLYSIPNISYVQQRKIAKILVSLDGTIEKTEALIEKYQQVKAGLMHDLFTRGITADGKLRPSREQAPELYQETTIGWIPRGWGFVKLGDKLTSPPKNGFSPREIDSWEGLYVLGLGCLTPQGFRAVHLKNSPRSAALSGAKLKDGDFLLSRANTPALVGLCGIYKDVGEDVIYPDLMMKLSLKDSLSPDFLELYLLSEATRIRITAQAVGTSQSMVKLNSTAVKKFDIACPPYEEQVLLVSKMKPILNDINSLNLQLNKLKKQKSGLMQDLLTGKVPVPLDKEPPHV